MSKIEWKPGTMVYPVPAVMVTCGDMNNSNIITVHGLEQYVQIQR